MDGQGQSWLAQLQGRTAPLLESLGECRELPISVTVMAALPKGSGFEEIVRGCTELGAAALIPLLSQRTLLKPSPHKLARWRRIAREAAEQCERQIVPQIAEPTTFPEAIAALGNSGLDCYICVARASADHLLTCLQRRGSNPAAVAIGPEGGWTEQEITQALAAGFQPVSLGSRILRSVTAPLVGLALIAGAAEQSPPTL
jgi:16S rRNA (uracil1498-N3)-methyltransferase